MIFNLKHALLFTSTILSTITFSQAYTIIPGKEKVYTKEEGVIFDSYKEVNEKTAYIKRVMTYAYNSKDKTKSIIRKVNLNNILEDIGESAIVTPAKKDGKMMEENILQNVVCNNKVLAVCVRNDLKTKKTECYLKSYDFDGIEKENGAKQLLLSDDYTDDRKFYRFYNAFFSQDGSKALVIRTANTTNRTTYTSEITGWIFETSNAKKLSEFSIPRIQNNLELNIDNDIIVLNNGDILWAGNVPENTSSDIPVISDVHYQKLPLSSTVFHLKLNEKLFKSINLIEMPTKSQDFHLKVINGTIYAYGVFLNKSNNNYEIFYTKLDINLEKFVSFNSVSLTSVINNKLKETLSKLTSGKIVIDGENVSVICENTYVGSYTGTGGTFYELLSRDLIVGKFNLNNVQKKSFLVPKFTDKGFINYQCYSHNSNLYLVYVEHRKNLEQYTLENFNLSKYHKIINIDDAINVCTIISADGTMKRETLFENKDWWFKPENLDIVIEKENALILHMIKGKKERFDKLILK